MAFASQKIASVSPACFELITSSRVPTTTTSATSGFAIETRLTDLSRVRVRFDYRLLRPLGHDQEEILAEGYTVLACVGTDHVPRRTG